MINPVSSITAIPMPAAPGGINSTDAFSGVLRDAVGSLQALNNTADSNIQKFLDGENEDIHTTVLATQRAEMAFELGLQVRNKVVSAYQEVMRMQL